MGKFSFQPCVGCGKKLGYSNNSGICQHCCMIARNVAGSGHPAWKGDQAGSDKNKVALHYRVRNARGRAAEHLCCECGKQARDWAQIHDADPYDVNNFQPMCRHCHMIYDGHNDEAKHGKSAKRAGKRGQ
jgi:hypothetical protein